MNTIYTGTPYTIHEIDRHSNTDPRLVLYLYAYDIVIDIAQITLRLLLLQEEGRPFRVHWHPHPVRIHTRYIEYISTYMHILYVSVNR